MELNLPTSPVSPLVTSVIFWSNSWTFSWYSLHQHQQGLYISKVCVLLAFWGGGGGGGGGGEGSLMPSLFIARGKRVWWNAYSILVPCTRSWRGQSDCRTVLTLRALLEKDANLKGPREGQSIGHSASDRRSYPSVWGRLSVLEARVRWEAQQFGANSGNVWASYHVTYFTVGTKIEYAFHQTLFPHEIKRLGTRLGGRGEGVIEAVYT